MGTYIKYTKEKKEKAAEYLKENYHKTDKTLKELAEELDFSERTLIDLITSCGLNKRGKPKDLEPGEIFGKLKVIGKPFYEWEPNGKVTRKRIECECLLCGDRFFTRTNSIHKGCSKSCGCSRKINRKRIYSLNESFFDNWSHDMAYILGFITADGNVSRSTMRIQLKNTDVEILEYIKEKLGYDGPILFITNNYTYKDVVKTRNQCILIINSYRMVKKLKEYHIIPAKTGKEVLPDIPDEYFYSYLLGLNDGDGCLFFAKQCNRKSGKETKRRLNFSLCSASRDFLVDIRTRCANGGFISKYSKSNCYQWRLGYHETMRICNLIYSRDGFSLQRKKDKYLKALSDS